MAIKTSKKATETTVKDFKNFTGVIPYHVVAVNPNLKELNELGIEYMKNEPEYITEQDYGNGIVKNSIIDFWVKSLPNEEHPEMDILTNIRFRINHEAWVGQSGKKQFINKYGRVSWAEKVSDLDSNKYFINEGTRQSHKGEEEVHKFIFSWLNMMYDTTKKEYDECLLDINKIVAGDFSELKDIVKVSSEYVVKILTGVNEVEKEGKIRNYQVLYNQMFLKHNLTSTSRLEEYINRDEYTEFKVGNGDLHYTFDIQEFNKNVKPDADPTSSEDVVTPEQLF